MKYLLITLSFWFIILGAWMFGVTMGRIWTKDDLNKQCTKVGDSVWYCDKGRSK